MAEHAPLVVIALELEGQGLFEQAAVNVLYTGLGKVNAALSLSRRLASLRAQSALPKMVVNFGTAGSRTFATGSVVACRSFVQRDMDVTGLGFALGETPFESLPATLAFPAVFPHLPEGVCGTGDGRHRRVGTVLRPRCGVARAGGQHLLRRPDGLAADPR